MSYTTSIGRMEHKVVGAKQVRWRQAPSGAWYGVDDDQAAEGPAGVHLVDGARLDAAKAAGQRALAAGHGGVLPDGAAPCQTCPACQYSYPERCRRPLSKAAALLRAGQQRDDDRARQRAEGRAILAELELTAAELAIELER